MILCSNVLTPLIMALLFFNDLLLLYYYIYYNIIIIYSNIGITRINKYF